MAASSLVRKNFYQEMLDSDQAMIRNMQVVSQNTAEFRLRILEDGVEEPEALYRSFATFTAPSNRPRYFYGAMVSALLSVASRPVNGEIPNFNERIVESLRKIDVEKVPKIAQLFDRARRENVEPTMRRAAAIVSSLYFIPTETRNRIGEQMRNFVEEGVRRNRELLEQKWSATGRVLSECPDAQAVTTTLIPHMIAYLGEMRSTSQDEKLVYLLAVCEVAISRLYPNGQFPSDNDADR